MLPFREKRARKGWRHTRRGALQRKVHSQKRTFCRTGLTSSLERKQAVDAQAAAAEKANKRAPAEAVAERPAKAAKPAPNTTVPDEYLPPNKTLFLRELPEDYGREQLAIIFSRFPGFREIRLVPGRNTIAFAEYDDETGAIAAKESTQGMQLLGQPIKVSYQRK